ALENARLFDETQRLLKETEARNAELAVINSIQQGLAGQLDLQAVIDLVGDKLREVFAASLVGIMLYDAERDRCTFPYLTDGDRRIELPGRPEGASAGISGLIVRTGQALVLQTA